MATCSSCSLLYNDVCIYASLNQNITIYIYIYIHIHRNNTRCAYMQICTRRSGPPGNGATRGGGGKGRGLTGESPSRHPRGGEGPPVWTGGAPPPRPPPRGRRPVRPGTQGTRGGPSTTHHPESKHAELLIPQPLLSCSFQQLSMAWN